MNVLLLVPATKGARNVVRDFVYGCWCAGRRIGGMQMPPTNLLYIATVLAESGHRVTLVDAAIDWEEYERCRRQALRYDALVLLTSTNSFRLDVQSCRDFKARNPDIKTVLFGSHPTFMPEMCLREESVDVVVRREPEFAIRDLFAAFDSGGAWQAVRGIGYRDGAGIQLNAYYPFIANMDDLPIPDRTFLKPGVDYFNPVVKRMPYTTMQTSRGCPARCTFCTVPSFFGKRIRVRSAGRVIEEFALLRGMGYREVFIRDETFTVHRKRNLEICEEMIRRDLDVTWICNARVDRITEDQIALMKRAGCHMIKFGVESGDQGILDDINKGIRLEQTVEAFAACHRQGMDAHAHVMLGCPGETKASIANTVEFVKRLNPTTASFGIFTPYPGTEVFNAIARSHPEIADGTEASLDKLHVTGFFNQYITAMPVADLERSVRFAYRKFYLRPGYLWQRLRGIDNSDELMRWAVAASNVLGFSLGASNQ